MAINKFQKQKRQNYLGSSDLPAVVGVDPWRSAHDIYLLKTDSLQPVPEKEDKGVIEIGHNFEKAVLDLFEKRHDVKLKRDLFLEHEHYCSNLDGLMEDVDGLAVVEAKTTGKVEEWGPSESDEIPERVLIQIHQQMHVVSKALNKECRVAWVPVLLPGYQNLDYRIYRIERNDDLLNAIIQMGDDFWNNHVIPRVPPENFLPSLDLLKRVRRVPEKTVKVEDALVDSWLTAKAEKLHTEKLFQKTEKELLVALGDAEAAEYSGGLITYYETKRSGFTAKPTKFRTLRKTKK